MRSLLARRFAKGVAAIELAFLLVPLVLFVLVGVEAGRSLLYYNTLLKSTRDASRYLSTQAAGTGTAEAQCLAVHGNTDCAGEPLLPGLATSMVEVAAHASVPMCTAPGVCYGTMELVDVKISGYTFHSFMVGFFPDATVGFTFGDVRTTMRRAVS